MLCGVDADGDCLCGIGVSQNFVRQVDSCEGHASTCCTQDTGYCYCEEGCEARFMNRLVASCTLATEHATCPSYAARVTSCD